jgi:hypothetical protein
VKPKYIPGIYNYCDRWCERCPFSSRCRNYEQANELNPGQNDITNKVFWDKVSQNFREAARVIQETVQSRGIDLTSISNEQVLEYTRKREMTRDTARSHPISTASLQYIAKARQLFERRDIMKEKADEMLNDFQLGISDEDEVTVQVGSIKESQEIITRYLHFIHVKFMRALMGKLEYDDPIAIGWKETQGFPNDSDGSAKIALIAIDQSIQAWTTMLHVVPAAEDEILYLLALLQRTRRMGEHEFPAARKFIRPGFDEK